MRSDHVKKQKIVHLFVIVSLFLRFVSFDLTFANESRVRVGVYPLTRTSSAFSPDNQILILGTVPLDSATSFRTNLTGLKFTGGGIENIDPKFLLIKNRLGVQKVYSFSLPSMMPPKPFRPMLDWKWSKWLPPLLLDVEKPRNGVVGQFLVELVLLGTSFTHFAPASILTGLVVHHFETNRHSEAAYLNFVLNNSAYHPALKTFLSEENQIEELKTALSTRYHPLSYENIIGAFRGAFFTNDLEQRIKAEQTLENRYSKNMQDLQKYAESTGLIVHPLFGDQFGIIYARYDGEGGLEFSGGSGSRIDLVSPQETFEKLKGRNLKKGDLVPLAVYTNQKPSGPSASVDFNSPGNNKTVLVSLISAAETMGFTVFPSFLAGVGIQIADNALRIIFRRKHISFFESSIRTYGEMRALFETGLNISYIPKVESKDGSLERKEESKVYFEAFVEYLKQWNVPEQDILNYKRRLDQNPTTAEATQVANEILAIMANQESHLITGYKTIMNRKSRYISWLEKFLSAEKSERIRVQRMDRFLSKRAEAKEEELANPLSIFKINHLPESDSE